MPPQKWSLTARWIVPVDRPPLAHGVLTMEGDRIASVSDHGRADLDWGSVVVVPGFVNAHTHLDLCGMRGNAPAGDDFVTWLTAVIAHRRGRAAVDVQEDIATGIRQSVRYGTLLVGDISAYGQSWNVLLGSASRSIVFWELIGLGRARARAAWEECDRWLRSRPTSSSCRPGLSPHAPYSARASLVRAAARRARRKGLPLAIHLAETSSEIDLIKRRHGALVDFLRRLGAWDESGPLDDLDRLYEWTRGQHAVSYIHGNCLDDLERIPEDATVVHCPRSHTFFGRSLDGLKSLRQAKIRLALGTDSLGSAPDLSILAEARHLWQQGIGIPPAEIITMATLNGARTLGWLNETGSLTGGKSADFLAIPLAGKSSGDPTLDLLENGAEVDTVVFRGQRQFGELPVPVCQER